MKRIVPGLFVFFCLLFSVSAETVSFGYGEWFPFTGKDLPEKGFFCQIVKEAYALQGVTVEYREYPWPRVEAMVESGDLAGSLGYLYTEERERKFLYTDSFWDENHSVAFFLKSRNFRLDSPDDLRGMTAIIQRSYSYGAAADEMIANGEIKTYIVDREMQAYQMLLAGRADLFLSSNINGNYYLSTQLPAEKEKFTYSIYDPSTVGGGSYVIISRKISNGNSLVDKFNRGLAQLKNSGRYDEIAAMYR